MTPREQEQVEAMKAERTRRMGMDPHSLIAELDAAIAVEKDKLACYETTENEFLLMRSKCQKLFQLLERNTSGGPPCDQDTGECYFCEYGIVADPDEWGSSEMKSPSFHKPDCPWRQAMEFIDNELDTEKS